MPNVADIIRESHVAFIVEVLGASYVPKEFKHLIHSVSKTTKVDPVTAAYVMGKLGLPVNVDDHIFEQQMSKREQKVEQMKQRLALFVRELADKAANKLDRGLLYTEDSDNTDALIKELAHQLVHELRVDFTRLLYTEIYNGVCEGTAAAFRRDYGPDCLVYKRTKADSCVYCKFLYDNGENPRVFRLSDLVSSGTNEYRKPSRDMLVGKSSERDWRAVVGSTHPWCRCRLMHLPVGYTFANGNVVRGNNPIIEQINKSLVRHVCVS